MLFPTRAEKLDRISALFQSKLNINKNGITVSAPECPLIWGVALRSMQRKSLGLDLSKLEKGTSDLWSAFVHDKEKLAEYGQLFSQDNFTKNLPKVITQLPIEKPYPFEDYFRDVVET